MTRFDTVRVASIQATPVILDAGASVEKAVALLREAAAKRWFDAVGHYSREDVLAPPEAAAELLAPGS